ncbi:hypothetical protein CXF70_05790 [Planomicrobium sp. MB-3u-38]|nr:hypothetical protein CXF70_05790 [Planomicrobium sp. MB-3u-38]
MNLRILELSWSLPLFVLTIIGLTIGLSLVMKNKNYRRFIPVIVIIYGLFYCVLQIYVLGKGYSGIPFVLIAWLLLVILLVAIIWIFISNSEKT